MRANRNPLTILAASLSTSALFSGLSYMSSELAETQMSFAQNLYQNIRLKILRSRKIKYDTKENLNDYKLENQELENKISRVFLKLYGVRGIGKKGDGLENVPGFKEKITLEEAGTVFESESEIQVSEENEDSVKHLPSSVQAAISLG